MRSRKWMRSGRWMRNAKCEMEDECGVRSVNCGVRKKGMRNSKCRLRSVGGNFWRWKFKYKKSFRIWHFEFRIQKDHFAFEISHSALKKFTPHLAFRIPHSKRSFRIWHSAIRTQKIISHLALRLPHLKSDLSPSSHDQTFPAQCLISTHNWHWVPAVLCAKHP